MMIYSRQFCPIRTNSNILMDCTKGLCTAKNLNLCSLTVKYIRGYVQKMSLYFKRQSSKPYLEGQIFLHKRLLKVLEKNIITTSGLEFI